MEQQRASLQDKVVRSNSHLSDVLAYSVVQSVLQKPIDKSESSLNAGRSLPRELSTLQSEMKDKFVRIEKIKDEIKEAKYDTKIQDVTNKMRGLEEQRELLNTELKNLSLQADARAKLDIKRDDLKKKSQSMNDIIEINNPKFRTLVGLDIRLATVEKDVERTFK